MCFWNVSAAQSERGSEQGRTWSSASHGSTIHTGRGQQYTGAAHDNWGTSTARPMQRIIEWDPFLSMMGFLPDEIDDLLRTLGHAASRHSTMKANMQQILTKAASTLFIRFRGRVRETQGQDRTATPQHTSYASINVSKVLKGTSKRETYRRVTSSDGSALQQQRAPSNGARGIAVACNDSSPPSIGMNSRENLDEAVVEPTPPLGGTPSRGATPQTPP